jgi:hypothetical protein
MTSVTERRLQNKEKPGTLSRSQETDSKYNSKQGDNTGGGPYKICGKKSTNGWQEVTKGRKGKNDVAPNKSGDNQSGEKMDNLNLLVGYIDFRLMCGKGFNVAGGIRAFITAGEAYDKQFAVLAMRGDGQDIGD